METKQINDEVEKLYGFLLPLKDPRFYSCEIYWASKQINIPVNELMKYAYMANTPESIMFENITNDHINIFNYNGVTYIGLESERIRYDKDKDKGINYVEYLIGQGIY